MNEDIQRQLGQIATKVDLIRQAESQKQLGVIVEPGGELADIPGLPQGVVEVYRIFAKLEGSHLYFEQPESISSREAWENREINMHDPFAGPLVVGAQRYGVPEGLDGVNPIYLDVESGGVFYCDPDDYVFLYKNPDEIDQVDIVKISPDIVSFFNDFVLGDCYPLLVSTVIGGDPYARRKGKGRYLDSWMGILKECEMA